MMQVYLVEPAPGDVHAFRNYQDIIPSLKISYSSCQDVEITTTPNVSGGPTFVTTGKRDGIAFRDELKVTRLPVWDSPTHI